MRPTDRRPSSAWLATGVTAALLVAVSLYVFLPGGAPRESLQPAALDTAPTWVSTTVPEPVTAATVATSAPTTALDTSPATTDHSVTPTPTHSSSGSSGVAGLPSTNTYPYHSTGPDWPGLNTTDPRCLPILRNQRVLELPDFRGKTFQQAVAAVDPIGMYSYCTNGTIIMTRFVRDADRCTDDPALAEHIAAQSPAPGTRVTPDPGIFEIHFNYFNPNLPCPTVTTTVAPPPATT